MLYKIFIPTDPAWAKLKTGPAARVIRLYQGNAVVGNIAQVREIKRLMRPHYQLDYAEVEPGDKLPGGDIYVNTNGATIAWTRKGSMSIASTGTWQFNTQSCIRSKVLIW